MVQLPPFSKYAGFAILLAVIGFALPLIGLIFSLVAVVLGHLAIDQIKRAPKPGFRGGAPARIALVMGYLSIVSIPFVAVGSYFSLPLVQTQIAKVQQKQIDSAMENARTLWQTAETYASEHGDRYPSNWTQLEGRYLSNPELRTLLTGRLVDASRTSFRLVPHERPILPALKGTVIVIHEVTPDARSGLNYDQIIVYDDGVCSLRAATTN